MCELVTNEKRVSSCPHLPLESPSKLHRYPVGIPQVFAYGSPSRLTQWPWKQGFYLLEQNLISLSATCKIIILAFIYLFFKSVQAWVRRKWEFPIKLNRKASLQSSLLSWFIFVDAPIFFFLRKVINEQKKEGGKKPNEPERAGLSCREFPGTRCRPLCFRSSAHVCSVVHTTHCRRRCP